MVAEFEFYVKQALVKKSNKCLIVEETKKKKNIKVWLHVNPYLTLDPPEPGVAHRASTKPRQTSRS